MSSGKGSGAGNGAGVQPIPAGSRKVVQSLKEIVNCSEAEIYAALKECNMDPNEAVNRLLSQDPFHEVKRKREKKKEVKDNPGPRSRIANNSSYRGSKGGSDRPAGRSLAPYNVSDSPMHGKSTQKKENESTPHTGYLSSSSVPESSRSQGFSGLSDSLSAENKGSYMGAADDLASAVQPTLGYQSAWVGVPGQVSMADIVRMGRTNNKALNVSNASYHIIQNPSATESLQEQRYSEDHAPQVHQSEAFSVQNVPTSDEWPSVEKPAIAKVISVPEYSEESKLHPGTEDIPFDSVNLDPHGGGVQEREDDEIGTSGGKHAASVSIISRKIQEDDSRAASLYGNEMYERSVSNLSEASDFGQQGDDEVDASVTSVTRNLQQLSVDKDENGFPSEGNAPSVVIPEHLQVQTVDCSHLSFGSFRPGMSSAFSSGPMASVPTKTKLDLVHDEVDISSVGHSDTRHSEYYADESLRNNPDGSLFHRTGASAENYDMTTSVTQREELQPESAEVVHGNQYSFPSNPSYAFDDKQNLTAPFNETGPEMQDLAPFSNVMHHNKNSLPSMLADNTHPNRESELQYSAFPVSQSLPSKYGSAVSSIGASAISMSEALRNAGLSSTQPALQTLSGTNVATGPPLPQQIALHPYSQTALPLGPYAGMMGYPFLPQSYAAYLPSAFPQSLAGSSTYHQSLASVLPQYKSSVSVSSMPESAAVASGYGAFGGNATVPGNYPTIPSAAPSGTTLSYDDVLSSQYKDNARLLMQQNENLAAWLHGANSRTMPAQYNYPGHNQQLVGLRQDQQQQQQQSQNYGTPAYPNFYHSQPGILLDHQQNPRDGALSNPQGQPKQPQIWPNGY